VDHVLIRCQQVGARLGIRPDFVMDLDRRIIEEACELEEDMRASCRRGPQRSTTRRGDARLEGMMRRLDRQRRDP